MAQKVADIIEYVTFVPLLPVPESNITDKKNVYPPLWVPTYSACAARQVEAFLRATMRMQVCFYEYAQRNNAMFEAIVDRRKKHFWLKKHVPESMLVGAFPDHVAGMHVLLAAQCGKRPVRELVELLNNPTETRLAMSSRRRNSTMSFDGTFTVACYVHMDWIWPRVNTSWSNRIKYRRHGMS